MLSESEKYIIACISSAKMRNDKAATYTRENFYKKDDPRKRLIEERNRYLNNALAECKKVYGICYIPILPYEEIVKEQSDILRTVLLMIHKNTKERAA